MPAHKLVAAALGLAFALAAPLSSSAQDAQKPKTAKALPRTADGHVDLQGVWDFRSATPLERPARFTGREFMTPDPETVSGGA